MISLLRFTNNLVRVLCIKKEARKNKSSLSYICLKYIKWVSYRDWTFKFSYNKIQ